MPDAHADRAPAPGRTRRWRCGSSTPPPSAASAAPGRPRTFAIAGLGLGLAWAVFNNNRLAQLAATRDTVYAAIQADGEVISSTHYSEAPACRQAGRGHPERALDLCPGARLLWQQQLHPPSLHRPGDVAMSGSAARSAPPSSSPTRWRRSTSMARRASPCSASWWTRRRP